MWQGDGRYCDWLFWTTAGQGGRGTVSVSMVLPAEKCPWHTEVPGSFSNGFNANPHSYKLTKTRLHLYSDPQAFVPQTLGCFQIVFRAVFGLTLSLSPFCLPQPLHTDILYLLLLFTHL